MNQTMQTHFANLQASDKELQYEAYNQIMTEINGKVDWAYDVWDQMIEDLSHSDNHRRSRAAQFLSGLAKSDPQNRMLEDFPAIWEVTRDEKFVTARHTLQSIWKIALSGKELRDKVMKSFTDRFINGIDEKNYTLIRFDIIQGLRNLYDETKDQEVKDVALELIEKEVNPKYKKKYAAVWKNA